MVIQCKPLRTLIVAEMPDLQASFLPMISTPVSRPKVTLGNAASAATTVCTKGRGP